MTRIKIVAELAHERVKYQFVGQYSGHYPKVRHFCNFRKGTCRILNLITPFIKLSEENLLRPISCKYI